jgi:hypothetical protein
MSQHSVQEPARQEWHDQPYKHTARAVCGDCNGGWMARLEDGVRPILERMLAGCSSELHAGGQRTLATWALKTAMMFDQASPAAARVIPSPYYRALMETGEPPCGVKAWIASYDQTQETVSYVNAAEVTALGEVDPTERNVFTRSFTIGPAAFQVFGSTSSALIDLIAAWEGRDVHQLWPTGESFVWTPRPALDDAGFMRFADSILRDIVSRTLRFEP